MTVFPILIMTLRARVAQMDLVRYISGSSGTCTLSCLCDGNFFPGDLEGPTSLVVLTPGEMSLSESNDPELGLILYWFGGELGPEEGKLFLTSRRLNTITSTGICYI